MESVDLSVCADCLMLFANGEVYGVGSTPTIFVNGVQLRVLSAEGLREAIGRAVTNMTKTQGK